MDFNDWTQPEEKTSQGYNNGNYRNPQRGYGNGYYRNPQQQQHYNNTSYPSYMPGSRVSQPDFNNISYSREEYYNQIKRKISEKEQNSNIGIVLGVVFLIWALGSIVGLIIFAMIKNQPDVVLALFGQFFAGMGIIAFVKTKRKSDNALILVFPIIGILLFAVGLISVFGNELLKQQLMVLVPFLIPIVFIIVGLVFVIAIPISDIKKRERCTDSVTALVVDIIRSSYRTNGHIRTVYHPVYEYYYKGDRYWERDTYVSKVGVPQIGNKVELFVNPDDPTDYYAASKRTSIIPIIFGMLCIVSAIIALVLMCSK